MDELKKKTSAADTVTAAAAQAASANGLPAKPSITSGGAKRAISGIPTISGNPTIVMNGEEVNGIGADAGDLSQLIAGLGKLKEKYNNSRFGNPNITLNEENGSVMLNGGDTGLKAKDYAGGVDDRTAAEGWAKATGNTLSQVSTYAGLTDLGDIVKYSDDKITIGGIEVPYAYIDNNGRAYASKAAIDTAIEQVRRDTGMQNPVKLTADIMDSHQRGIKNAVNNVVNRRSWSYSPDNDPAYEAYVKQYTRNAEQLYNRAMGSGGLYGSPNSYQMYQALAAYGDNMQKLSDMVPQLTQQDYARYSDEQTRNRYALEALQNERSADLSAAVAANDNMYNRYRAADELNYNRRRDALYNDPKEKQELRIGDNSVAQSDAYTARYPTILDLQTALQSGELTATGIANVKAMLENAVYRANMNGGVFSKQDMDALGIGQNLAKYPNSNGYPTVHAAEIQRLLDTWNIVEKPKALFGMGL